MSILFAILFDLEFVLLGKVIDLLKRIEVCIIFVVECFIICGYKLNISTNITHTINIATSNTTI